MKKVGVVLSGCGVYDGAEIHETVLTLLAIARNGAQAVCFAPDKQQADVINHLTGEPMQETRNVLIEAARITRGDIRPLAQAVSTELDALIVPGGFGAAKNLSNFASQGSESRVDSDLAALAVAMHQAGKPLGFMCIAPAMLPKIFDFPLRLTIGTDIDTAEVLEEMGAEHVPCPVDDIVVDEDNKIVTTPPICWRRTSLRPRVVSINWYHVCWCWLNEKGVTAFLRRIFLRAVVVLAVFWGGGIALFSVMPVPFSAVMVERQLSAWLSGDFGYVAHSDWVSMDEISPWMGLAVIAAEDQKFPEHWGFDVSAIEKALAHNERNENRIRGASTLSQQTAKNLFLWDGRSWVRKGLEAGLTLGMETVWSKKRILTVYLNIAEFGDGVFGVEAAAQRYFHKPASRLSLSEAALLAAVLPNPLRFKANAPSGYVRSRQAWIMRQMRQLGGESFMRENKLY